MLDRTMRSRVRSTRKKPEVFKWTKCMEDFVHGQLGLSEATGDRRKLEEPWTRWASETCGND
ncbi:MAG: hypothetical protein DWI23_06185 [Planctomycetota bacterium]|nr:MAG: hypothetical protein DWI23_06185 [Planctomycetota bacterium]